MRCGNTKKLHRFNRPTLLGILAREEKPRDAEAELGGQRSRDQKD